MGLRLPRSEAAPPLRGGKADINIYKLGYKKLYLCGRETMVLYRDCFDDGGACWMRGWTPPAFGHPLSEGDDLTPALSWRRGSGLTCIGEHR